MDVKKFLFFLLIVGVLASPAGAPRVFASNLYYSNENDTTYTANSTVGRFHLVGYFYAPAGSELNASSTVSYNVENLSCTQMGSGSTGGYVIASTTSPTVRSGFTGDQLGAFANPTLAIGAGVTAVEPWTGGTVSLNNTTLYGVYVEANCSSGQEIRITGTDTSPLFLFQGYITDENGFVPPVTSTTTRIVDFNPKDETVNPTSDLNITSSDVTMTAEWFFNSADYGSFDQVCVSVAEIENGFQYIPDCFDIDSSGGDSVIFQKNLFAGTHFAIVYFYNSSTGAKGVAKGYQFINLYSRLALGLPAVGNTISPDISYGTTTDSSGFLKFLNVPSLLQNKVPFAYFFQFYDEIRDTDSISATSTGLFILDLGLIASGTPIASVGQITIFSTSTITDLMPDGFPALMRSLMVAVMYIGAGFFMFHSGRNAIHKHQ